MSSLRFAHLLYQCLFDPYGYNTQYPDLVYYVLYV